MEQEAAPELPLSRSTDFAAVDHEVIAVDFKARHPLAKRLCQRKAKLFHIDMMTGRNDMREIHCTEVVVDGSASRAAADDRNAIAQRAFPVHFYGHILMAAADNRRSVPPEHENLVGELIGQHGFQRQIQFRFEPVVEEKKHSRQSPSV